MYSLVPHFPVKLAAVCGVTGKDREHIPPAPQPAIEYMKCWQRADGQMPQAEGVKKGSTQGEPLDGHRGCLRSELGKRREEESFPAKGMKGQRHKREDVTK